VTIHHVEQGSPAWHALRCGKVTASRISDVCAKDRSGRGWGKTRANYMAELILERMTGKPYQGFHSRDMEGGNLFEPDGRAEYELRYRCEVQQIGFVDHPFIPMAGASADGFVGERGLIELKCPKPNTHLEYLRKGVVPSEYIPQINWNFACNPTRMWCDFVSYNPDFPAQMQLFKARIEPDITRIAEIEQIVREFLSEIDSEVSKLCKTYLKKAAA
jgi:YqaJ-like viral recombinase domain